MKSIMKRVFLSMGEMEKAFNKVRKELEAMDLLFDGSRLDKVDCYHERFSIGALYGLVAMGFYNPADQNIHIPAAYPPGLFPWLQDREMRDVIRHEFGHALADKYRKIFRGGIFKEAFGKSYGTWQVFDGDDCLDEYVSDYATTNTREDFAETFMLYMKYKGKMPARFRGKRAIVKKWKTVGRIIREIAALRK